MGVQVLCVRQSVSNLLYIFLGQPCDLNSIVPILQIEELMLVEIN